jgi:O-antigen/teichoic acid export membrane protein
MAERAGRLRLPAFLADVAALFSGRVAMMALMLLGSILAARWLGPERKGVVAALLAAPQMILTFADLGVRQAITYYLGKKIYSERQVIATMLLLLILTSLLSAGILLLVYQASGMAARYGWLAVSLPFFLLPFRLMSAYGSGVLMAGQQIRALSIASVLMEAAYLALLLALGLPGWLTVESALAAQVLAAGCAGVYVARLVSRHAPLRPAYFPGLPQEFVRRGVVYALALFILSLNYRLDVLIMERISTAKDVGVYSVGVAVAEMLWLLPAALTTVNFARSAAAADAQAHAQKTALMLRLVLWGGLLPVAVLYLLAPWLIPLIYGGAYADSGLVVRGILPGVWMGLIFKVLNSDLAGRGRPEAALWVYALAVAVNVALNLWWIPLYGAVGSAWASSVSYSLGALIFAAAYARLSRVPLADLFLPRVKDFALLLRRG